jgi:hypothetical protein
MQNKKLTKKEMESLQGGVFSDLVKVDFGLTTKNINSVKDCVCTYFNGSVIKNINKVTGCVCVCN